MTENAEEAEEAMENESTLNDEASEMLRFPKETTEGIVMIAGATFLQA